MQMGLSCAIMNPGNEDMMCAYRAFLALSDLDPQCMGYIEAYANAQRTTVTAAAKTGAGCAAAGSADSAGSGGAKASAAERAGEGMTGGRFPSLLQECPWETASAEAWQGVRPMPPEPFLKRGLLL